MMEKVLCREQRSIESHGGGTAAMQCYMERSAISIELRMVSASGDNLADETLGLLSD